jgi:hypothetical protein
MKFKFRGIKVEVVDDELICDDDLTRDVLTPLFNITSSDGPEFGDPFLNLITQAFGNGAVTEFEDDANMIY